MNRRHLFASVGAVLAAANGDSAKVLAPARVPIKISYGATYRNIPVFVCDKLNDGERVVL